MKHESHPFGDLIRQHLSRKHGLSQNKLAEGIDQDPAIVAKMCKGERLTGPQARERVISIIHWFYTQEVLTSVIEANALLETAGMAQLNYNSSEEVQLLNQLTLKPPSTNEPVSKVALINQYKTNLVAGRNINTSAKGLGTIAVEYRSQEAVRTLWEVICETQHLSAIIDPCAYTIGRIVWATLDPTLENIGFEIFDESVSSKSEPIVDKFAYVVGEVVLRTEKDNTRRRARRFVNANALSRNPLVQEKYSFTQNRIAELLVDDNHNPVFPPPVALTISVKAEVNVRRAGTNKSEVVGFGTPLYRGDIVSTFARAEATIVCDNDLLFVLPENNNFTVECVDGDDPRLIGPLGDIVPNPLISLAEAFGLPPDLSTTRTVGSRAEQSQIPLLLSPRNTLVTDPRPTFHWQPVEGAGHYLLSVAMPGGKRWERETTNTFLPYPDDVSPLTPGSANLINLLAFSPTFVTTDKTLLRLPDEARLGELTEAKTTIRSLVIDETAQSYLLAQLYQEQELWADAIIQLEQLATESNQPSASLLQQLGDLYVKVGLYSQAEQNYQRAITVAEAKAGPSFQAVAHTGLARVTAAFAEFQQAHHHLTTAEILYREAGETVLADIVGAERSKLEQ